MVRREVRYRHYALSTEKAYVHWVKFFVKFHGLRHPREMGVVEVEGFCRTWPTSVTSRHPRIGKPWQRCCFCMARC